jgi:hypothetical protein
VIVGGIDAAASFASGLLAQPASSAATRAMFNKAIGRFVISASSCERDPCPDLIERLEARGEGASYAGIDEVLLAGAGDTHDASERVNSLRDELEREHREGNQDAEPDDDHAHRCETSHSPAPPLSLSASALPKWSPQVRVEESVC